MDKYLEAIKTYAKVTYILMQDHGWTEHKAMLYFEEAIDAIRTVAMFDRTITADQYALFRRIDYKTLFKENCGHE